MNFKAIVFLAAGVAGLIIIFQNSQAVAIKFLFWQVSMSGILLFPLVFALGLLCGWLLSLFFPRSK